MKKLSTAFAACMLAGFVSAQVESQNVVGYNTVIVPAGQEYQILGCGLKTVVGSTNTIGIQDFITDPRGAGFTGSNSALNADQLWVFLDGGYKTFFLYYHATLNTSRNNKWVNSADMSAYGGGAALQPSTYAIPAGGALWIKRKTFTGEISFTTPGEVVNDVSASKTLVTGFNFMGSFFAADWELNASVPAQVIDWRGAGATGSNSALNADQMWVFLDGGYKTFFLYYHATLNTSRNNKWVNAADMSAYGGGTALQPTTYKIPFGAAAWYLAKTGYTFNQPRPYTL